MVAVLSCKTVRLFLSFLISLSVLHVCSWHFVGVFWDVSYIKTCLWGGDFMKELMWTFDGDYIN